MITNSYRTYGQLKYIDEKLIVLISRTFSVCSFFGRIINGYLVDKLPFKLMLSVILIFYCFLGISLSYIVSYPYIYFIMLSLFAFCLSGQFMSFVNCYPRVFGIRESPSALGISNLITLPNSLIASIIAKIIIHKLDDYKIYFFIGSGICFFNLLILLLLFKDQPFKYKNYKNKEKGEELILK